MDIKKRQQDIFEFIQRNGLSSNVEIKKYLQQKYGDISRITVVRDIDDLIRKEQIVKQGKGRSVKYKEAIENKLLYFYDVEEYFTKGPDERDASFERFNPSIFDNLGNILSETELKELNSLNEKYKQRLKTISDGIAKKEFQRLAIELSWKSSQIEGNTYSLIDTEILIKEKKEAKGHKKEEAIMILNHKDTIDYIFESPHKFKKISVQEIENIHRLLVKELDISFGLRKNIVGITGTRYKPLDNQYQIREALDKIINTINQTKEPLSKCIIAILMLSYLQPFEDGNKRTARLTGNALLMANDFCPLSFRSIDESDYKKAMILFFEQNSARFFKKLFIEQFKFSVNNYFV